MKTFKLLVLILMVPLLLLILVNTNSDWYYWLLKKSGEVYNTNRSGKFEGRGRVYKDGIKIFDGFFRDGKLDGLATSYDNGGTLKSRRFYKLGKINGLEFHYYENGKISFKGSWRNGAWYGSQYYFENDGNLLSYDVRDFRPIPNDFFTIIYKKDSIRQILGTVVSKCLATYNNGNLQILKEENNYKNIEDLYLTVACPPKLKTSLQITINGRTFSINELKKNTVKIKGVLFELGEYKVTVVGTLENANRLIKSDTVSLRFNKTL